MSDNVPDRHQDKPEDNRSAKAKAAAMNVARQKNKERIEKEMKDAAKLNKDRIDTMAKRDSDNEATAKTLKPTCAQQLVVEARLTGKTTEMVGAALRHVSAKAKERVRWMCVSKHHARDVMQRAYPLGLQMGIMTVPNEQHHTLTLHNGSSIDFWWPGKAEPATMAK